MKRVLVVQFVILLAAGAAWGKPSGIDIISEQHHVWGGAGDNMRQSYDLTASERVYGAAYGMEEFPPGHVYRVQAISMAGSWGVYASAVRWTSSARAESVYVFVPEDGAGSFALDVTGKRYGHPFEEGIALTLKDLTTMTVLDQFSWPYTPYDWEAYETPGTYWGGTFAWSRVYYPDPSHTYSLTLYAWARGGDQSSMTYLQVAPDHLLTPVPTPAATILVGLGAGVVGWLRRRRTL